MKFLFLLIFLSFPLYASSFDWNSLRLWPWNISKIHFASPTPTRTTASLTPAPNCANLYEDLCKGISPTDRSPELVEKYESFYYELYGAYFVRALELDPGQIFEPKKSISSNYRRLKGSLSTEKHFQALMAAEQESFSLARMNITSLKKIFQEAKSDLGQAISELPLPQIKKDVMQSQIADIQYADAQETVRLLSDFLMKDLNLGTDQSKDVIDGAREAYEAKCGEASTGLQAFTIEGHFIHICPGSLISSVFMTDEQMYGDLYGTILHELGHSLVHESSVNENLQSCITSETPLMSGHDESQRRHFWENKKTELVADSWVKSAFMIGLQTRESSKQKAFEHLSGIIKGYCQIPPNIEDHVHPSARFRSEMLLQNHDLLEAIGCPIATRPRSLCSLL